MGPPASSRLWSSLVSADISFLSLIVTVLQGTIPGWQCPPLFVIKDASLCNSLGIASSVLNGFSEGLLELPPPHFCFLTEDFPLPTPTSASGQHGFSSELVSMENDLFHCSFVLGLFSAPKI